MGLLLGGNIRMAIRDLRRNKMRSLLTMLGIIIGVLSVVLVLGIGEGIKHQVSVQTEHLGKDLITVRPGRLMTLQTATMWSSGGIANPGLHLNGSLSAKDVTTITDTPGVAGAAPLSVVGAGVASSERSGTYNDLLVIGTNQQFPTLIRQSMAYGSFFTDTATSVDKVVIGSKAAQMLFDEHVPLGQTLTVLGHQFIVTGILNDFQTIPFSADADFNSAIFIPYSTARTITNDDTPIYEILARPSHPDPAATDTTVRAIQSRLIVAHGGSNDTTVLKQDQTLAVTNQILHLITLLIVGVAAIALLVGGVGIMNVMLVSVVERMHEIGIRKALGATNRQIVMQFLTEAVVLSIAGGSIGVLLAGTAEGALWLLAGLTPGITWQVVVISLTVSVATGVLFGSLPALKAARKEPIAALRNE